MVVAVAVAVVDGDDDDIVFGFYCFKTDWIGGAVVVDVVVFDVVGVLIHT